MINITANTFYRCLYVFVLLLTVSFTARAGSSVLNQDIITQRFSFEQVNDFNNWQVVNGQLNLSKKHFKDGQQSLQWQWKYWNKHLVKIELKQRLTTANPSIKDVVLHNP